jgi:hypothetical protein
LSKIFLILLVVALAGNFFCWGLIYHEIGAVPEIIGRTIMGYINQSAVKPEVVNTVTEKIIIEKVPVIEYVEIEKEVPAELKQFESEEALTAWLDADKTNELPYIKDLFECENFARTLIRHALREGYYLSFQVLKNYTRPDTNEFIAGPHAINSTIIGNVIYFIDPQTDDFWLAYVLENEAAE